MLILAILASLKMSRQDHAFIQGELGQIKLRKSCIASRRADKRHIGLGSPFCRRLDPETNHQNIDDAWVTRSSLANCHL
jgi:hypothetical protein